MVMSKITRRGAILLPLLGATGCGAIGGGTVDVQIPEGTVTIKVENEGVVENFLNSYYLADGTHREERLAQVQGIAHAVLGMVSAEEVTWAGKAGFLTLVVAGAGGDDGGWAFYTPGRVLTKLAQGTATIQGSDKVVEYVPVGLEEGVKSVLTPALCLTGEGTEEEGGHVYVTDVFGLTQEYIGEVSTLSGGKDIALKKPIGIKEGSA